jgi:hypothetical protein
MKLRSNSIKTAFSDKGIQLLLIVGLTVSFILSCYIHIPMAFDGTNPYDFPNYYFGGKRVLEGRPIYDYLEKEVYETLGWHNSVYPADPPLTVLLLSPLALLSYVNAWILWAILSTLLFSLSIFFTAKELGFRARVAILFVAIALSSNPFRLLLFSNHAETLLLATSISGWILLRRKYERLGLLMWAIAANLKLFPLLWIVGSYRLMGKRKIAEALLSFLAIFFISGCLIGLNNLNVFLFDVIARSRLWYGVVSNCSLLSFIYAFNLNALAWVAEVLFAFLVTVFILKRKNTDLDCQWTALVVASLILSPLCWWRYLILVFPVILILAFSNKHKSSQFDYLLLLAALIMWGWPEYIDTGFPVISILLSFVPLAVLAALYWISLIGCRSISHPLVSMTDEKI